MALITRATTASLDASSGAFSNQITGLVAGEALDIAAPCYVKAADGKAWMCNATGTGEASIPWGFTPRAVAAADQPVTLLGKGSRFSYGTGLTIGARLYVGATAGRLDGVATVGDAVGVALVVTATDILVIRDS